jgi:hypothetical protein
VAGDARDLVRCTTGFGKTLRKPLSSADRPAVYLSADLRFRPGVELAPREFRGTE